MITEKNKVWLHILGNLFLHYSDLFNHKTCRFLSDRQTIEALLETKKGIARFGDGELGYLSGYSYPHQRQDPCLRNKLRNILDHYSNDTPYLIGLPAEILFNSYHLRGLPKRGWRAARYTLYPYVQKNRLYGSAFCFRILTVVDEDRRKYTQLLLKLFEGKEVVYVGGATPYPGLIQVARYIPTPQINAFTEYKSILKEVKRAVTSLKWPVVVFSCGITATALSAEVNEMGIPAYDVGLCFTKRLAAFL